MFNEGCCMNPPCNSPPGEPREKAPFAGRWTHGLVGGKLWFSRTIKLQQPSEIKKT